MTRFGAHISNTAGLAGRLASRGDLTGFLMGLAQQINADSYMLVAILHDQNRNDVRIISSNWIYDAIQLVGHQLIASIAQSPLAAAPGSRPRPFRQQQGTVPAGRRVRRGGQAARRARP